MKDDNATEGVGWAIHAGVFLASLATLQLEVTLTRVFSYTIWYHFAFATISVALLGFGASGAVLALWRRLGNVSLDKACGMSTVGAGVGVILVQVLISSVPFYPFDAGSDPRQILHGGLYMLAVTVPFFFAGLTAALALSRHSERAPSLYFANLIGAGVGCLVVPVLFPFCGQYMIGVSAAVFCAASLAFVGWKRPLLAVTAFAVAAGGIASGSAARYHLDTRKRASIATEFGGEPVFTEWSMVFRTDLIAFTPPEQSRRMMSHGTIGVGKEYKGPVPNSRLVVHDGDGGTMMLNWTKPAEEFSLFQSHILALPYLLRPGAEVYVGGVGGGSDLFAALVNGAAHVDGVELDPLTVDLLATHYADYIGNMVDSPKVDLRAGDARSVLARGGKDYDIVQFSGVDTIASVAAGAHLLSESYLYTVEAVETYLDHLKPEGILCFVNGDYGKGGGEARMAPRLCSLAVEALRRRGVEDPGSCVVAISSRPAPMVLISLLIKTEPFTEAELDQLRGYVAAQGFDIWHMPGEAHDNSVSKILASDEEERRSYVASHYLDFSPTMDDRPFFLHFYKWPSLFSHMSLGPRFTEATGNLVLLGVLAFSVLGSILLILIPATVHAKREGLPVRKVSAELLYFCAIGFGFMFLEIPLIQRMTLFLGYPTYSLTITLFSILVFAGIGSFLSGRMVLGSPRPLWILLGLLALVAVVHAFVVDGVLSLVSQASLPVRAGAACVAIAPLGLLLGMFFPTGIRELGRKHPKAVPLAWASNGSCSVVGTALALVTATVVGFRATFLIALGLYLVAVLSMRMSILSREETS